MRATHASKTRDTFRRRHRPGAQLCGGAPEEHPARLEPPQHSAPGSSPQTMAITSAAHRRTAVAVAFACVLDLIATTRSLDSPVPPPPPAAFATRSIPKEADKLLWKKCVDN